MNDLHTYIGIRQSNDDN